MVEFFNERFIIFNLFLIIYISILVIPTINSARLPIVGGDEDTWGDVLVEYLNISLDQNGSVKENVINSTHILDGTINSSDFASNSINSTHITDSAINTASKIVNGIITGAKLVAGTITGVNIAVNAINNTHIEDLTITASDIGNGVITATKLVTGIITSDYIGVNAINNTHILDGTISGDDIDSTANITIGTINATAIDIGFETFLDDCSGGSCLANVTCPSGKSIVFGLYADDTFLCDTIPLNCNNYCTFGSASCTATATAVGASVYAVCGKVQ